MIRGAFIVVVVVHGLIHLMGFAKASGFAALPQLVQPISRTMGAIWLIAAALLAATAATVALLPRWWWLLGTLALIASQCVIAASWSDAKVGTLANLVLLVGVLYGFASRGPLSMRAQYERHLHQDGLAPRPAVITEADLAPLPEPVQRYVRGAGVVGRSSPRNFRATWRGRIRSSATSPWMAFTAEQLSTLDPPQRFFKMDAVMKGLPVDVLHAFDERGATMRVNVLSLFPMVNAKGPNLTRAETVTLFNDLCILAPGALISPLITWEPIDASTARARFTLRENSIGAELRFNAAGELVSFASDDRSAGSADGSALVRMRWATPLNNYAQTGPARVATRGDAVWYPASGPYTYGEFELTSLAYDVRP
jgi:hypothetical protein